jgi:hypothetical protein
MHDDIRDPVPPLAHAILELYRGPLAEVRFPDLDRDVLDVATDELLAAQRDLEAAERALDAARSVVEARTAALMGKVQRGLSYARIFAEDQPELRDQLASLASAPRRAEPQREESANAPKKRGRPRKIREEDAVSLFGGAPSTDDDESEAAEAAA